MQKWIGGTGKTCVYERPARLHEPFDEVENGRFPLTGSTALLISAVVCKIHRYFLTFLPCSKGNLLMTSHTWPWCRIMANTPLSTLYQWYMVRRVIAQFQRCSFQGLYPRKTIYSLACECIKIRKMVLVLFLQTFAVQRVIRDQVGNAYRRGINVILLNNL